MQKIKHLIFRLKETLSARQFLVFAAVIVGIAAGILAVMLKLMVGGLHHLFNTDNLFSPEKQPFMVVFPLVGIVLSVLITQKLLRGRLERGVSHVLYEIAKKSAFVRRHKMYSQALTSAITVGLGGSAGLEAPIVVTGSAVGSNLATLFGQGYRERTLLLGCGAAAGIAAVFNAPIAGVMFALEVLLADVTVSAFVPLVISAACGALLSRAVLDENTLFYFKLLQEFNWLNTPFYLILAIITATVSLYYVRMAHWISTFFKKLNFTPYSKALFGGLILAVLVYLFPALFGEGYSSIKQLAAGKPEVLLQKSIFSSLATEGGALLIFLGLTLFLKVVATTVTLGSGGNGGNFAPSLFVGSFTGFTFARLMNTGFGLQLPEGNFTIVGMAGVLSGVMYAPLTAIFLIAEVAGGYDLMIPLMIVSTFSTFFVRQFEPIAPEVRDMVERGEVFSEDKDQNILMMLRITDLIETDFKTVPAISSLGQLVNILKISKRNLFAVINTEGVLEGILTLDDVRSVMFDVKLYDKLFVEDLMKQPPAILTNTDTMQEAMQKFDDTQAWNLPVVDAAGRYVGFVSKSAIFSNYRTQLKGVEG
jgi:chloride channel protein, CIC family